MKRTLLFFLLLLSMLASIDAVEINGIYYNIDIKGKTAEVISSPDYYKGDIVIPKYVTFNGVIYSVTSIGDKAFISCYGLTSVTIPEGVTSIGQEAFSTCRDLTYVIIPESVKSIGDGVFSLCNRLTSITIPNGVTSIGDRAFYSCSGLKSVTIPSSITDIGKLASYDCTSLTSVNIPESLTSIGYGVFMRCCRLKSVIIPDNVTSIGDRAFEGCNGLTTITIPNNVISIGADAISGCCNLTSVTIGSGIKNIGQNALNLCEQLIDVYCYAKNVPGTNGASIGYNFKNVTLHVPAASISAYQATEPWMNFKEIVALPAQYDYRPFVEDGKVWKVGAHETGNPVQVVEYYYFDGDTIINGKNCKKMMCQRYTNPDYPVVTNFFLIYYGAYYEENKQVYVYNTREKQFTMIYDFSPNDNGAFEFNNIQYVIRSKQTGGLKGFKGVYRDVKIFSPGGINLYNTIWLEGVGGIDGPTIDFYSGYANPAWFLMSCTVGDEVIYFNEDYEDGATPEGLGARKRRFDFTHTIKTQPKARNRSGAEQPVYGEYNDLQLGINLDPLDDAYQVRITDESGKVVYEKAINAGNIVGLNIDISSYAKGRYTVTVENSTESFTGEFEAQTTGIRDVRCKKEDVRNAIYNLQGQRLSTLQKGLNIVNGKKVYVK